MDLDLILVRTLLHYNPWTGAFRWRHRPRHLFATARGFAMWNTRFAGTVAGGPNDFGYTLVSVFKKRYRAHRLAWLYVTGRWPIAEIDHINHVPSDNRWLNLREVDHTGQMRNTSPSRHNTSGVRGVWWHKLNRKWSACITIDNRTIHLGTFHDIADATAARQAAEQRYGFHVNHGER